MDAARLTSLAAAAALALAAPAWAGRAPHTDRPQGPPALAGAKPAAPPPCLPTAAARGGPRVALIYAIPAGMPDRSELFAPVLAGAAAAIQRHVALASSGRLTVRFVTARECPSRAAVGVLRLAHAAGAYVGAGGQVRSRRLARELPRAVRSPRRHALVLVDGLAGTLGGIAELRPESRWGDRPDAGGSAGFVWGPPGMDPAGPGAARLAELLAHELFHLLGAVQAGAPHASAGGHCSQEWDLMCYDDGSLRAPLTIGCAPLPGPIRQHLDCGRDDYFSPSPAPGSWLARRWNTYRSRFLAPCRELPAACSQAS